MATPVFILSPEQLEELITKVIKREVGLMLNDPSLGGSFSDENWTRARTAKFLGMSEQKLTVLALKEEIVGIKSGRTWHFAKSNVMKYIRNTNN
jgi:hypothetical protein